MADQGDQEQSYEVDYSAEQAAMQDANEQLHASHALSALPVGGAISPVLQAQAMQNIADAKGRMEKKAQLADAASSGSTMRIDPDQVDKLAGYFEAKADELAGRRMDLSLLADVQPPGGDPVSSGAARAYSEVGQGDERAYMNNYLKLVEVFRNTAAELKGTAQQTRSDDLGAEEGFGKGLRA